MLYSAGSSAVHVRLRCGVSESDPSGGTGYTQGGLMRVLDAAMKSAGVFVDESVGLPHMLLACVSHA